MNEGDGQHAPPQSQEKDEGGTLRLVGSLARIFANLFSFQADPVRVYADASLENGVLVIEAVFLYNIAGS